MRLDRALRHHELRGYLGVGLAAHHQVEDLPLAAGEPGERGRGRHRHRAARGELGQQPPGHRGGEQGPAVGRGPHAEQQLLRRRVLEQESAGPGAQCLVHVLIQVVGGQDDHPHLMGALAGRLLGGDAAGGGQPVHQRHPDVHEHDVGPRLAGEPPRPAPRWRIADARPRRAARGRSRCVPPGARPRSRPRTRPAWRWPHRPARTRRRAGPAARRPDAGRDWPAPPRRPRPARPSPARGRSAGTPGRSCPPRTRRRAPPRTRTRGHGAARCAPQHGGRRGENRNGKRRRQQNGTDMARVRASAPRMAGMVSRCPGCSHHQGTSGSPQRSRPPAISRSMRRGAAYSRHRAMPRSRRHRVLVGSRMTRQ